MGGSRTIAWRKYVYDNELYSLPSQYDCSYRENSPYIYRRDSNALSRILKWVCRDLIALKVKSADRMCALNFLASKLLGVKLFNKELVVTMAPFVGTKTKQFLHEIRNFACSPFDDRSTYDIHALYVIRQMNPDANIVKSYMEFCNSIYDSDTFEYLDLDEVYTEFLLQLSGTSPLQAELEREKKFTQIISGSEIIKSLYLVEEPTTPRPTTTTTTTITTERSST